MGQTNHDFLHLNMDYLADVEEKELHHTWAFNRESLALKSARPAKLKHGVGKKLPSYFSLMKVNLGVA